MNVAILSLTVVLLLAGCGKEPPGKQSEEPEDRVSVPPGAPRAVFSVPEGSEQLMEDTVREFAKRYGFRECEVPHYSWYSGPGYVRVLYKNDPFAIWAWQHGPAGVFHITPNNTNYTSQEFGKLTNSLAAALQQVFPTGVELNPTNRYK
jgi:hypothetical protein